MASICESPPCHFEAFKYVPRECRFHRRAKLIFKPAQSSDDSLHARYLTGKSTNRSRASALRSSLPARLMSRRTISKRVPSGQSSCCTLCSPTWRAAQAGRHDTAHLSWLAAGFIRHSGTIFSCHLRTCAASVRRYQILSAWRKILGGQQPSLSIEITRECPGGYAYDNAHLGGGTT